MEEATGISYTPEEKGLCLPFYTDWISIVLLYDKYNYIWKGNSMKVLPVRRCFLWAVLVVVVVIIIYRIGFHRPVPGFNEEAIRKLMTK